MSLTVQDLVDMSVEENIPPDRDFHYVWDEYAKWQYECLVELGIKPHHYLLDIGCGPMRLGHLMVPYLESGHYFGVDRYEDYLRLGHRVMQHLGNGKDYSIAQTATFDFQQFGEHRYDYAFAQSVLTHMSDVQIEDCLSKLKAVMAPGGIFVFTYFLGGKLAGFLYDGTQPMMRPRLDDTGLFERLAGQLGITFEKTSIPHPSQTVGLFRF